MQARAIHELQLQAGICLKRGTRSSGAVYAAEFIDAQQWKKLAKLQPLLILSSTRARALGLKTTSQPLALNAGNIAFDQLLDYIAGTQIKTIAPVSQAPDFADALIGLAKQAGVLPALLWVPSQKHWKNAMVMDVAALYSPLAADIIRGETVSLPVEGAEDSTLTGFRTRYGAGVHLALVIGMPERGSAPLVRVHSSCVTGDLLGSLRCDCGGQLKLALDRIKQEGAGILLYLHQEGRDIGISSKLRAYRLQEQGLDTFEANQQLGFEEDERDFDIASAILKSLGHTRIRLLTNNPDKVVAFSNTGIKVEKRLSLHAGKSSYNEAYLAAKHSKHGHHH